MMDLRYCRLQTLRVLAPRDANKVVIVNVVLIVLQGKRSMVRKNGGVQTHLH